MVDNIYEKWCLFLYKLVEYEPHYPALGKAVKDYWGLIQNPETKVNIKFLVSFGKYYCTPGYNWLRRNFFDKRLEKFQS